MFEIPIEYVAFIAIILGVIGRTYFPYLRKMEQNGATGEPFTFDIKFVITAIFSGLVTAVFVFPLFVMPDNATNLTVFISAFIFAWGANDVVNRVAHTSGATVTATKEVTVTTPSTELK